MRGLDNLKSSKKNLSLYFSISISYITYMQFIVFLSFLTLQAFIRCWKYFKIFRAFDGRSRFQLFLTSAQFELALSQS